MKLIAQNFLKLCLPAMLVGWNLVCFGDDAVYGRSLLAEALVDSRGIFLNQLVTGETNLLIRIGDAPALGRDVTLTRAQLADLLLKSAAGINTTNWSGAEKIKITRRTKTLAEDELKELLTATLQSEQVRDRGELELRLTRSWLPVAVPDEPLTLKIIDLPASGVSPNFIVRFELRCGAETIGSWQVPVQAHVWLDVPVAHSPLKRGEVLPDADITKERRDVLTLRDALPVSALQDGSLELAENISAGVPLVSRSVRPHDVILRGKLLDAIVQDGTLSISVKVEALENGRLGQNIRVRNIKSRKDFLGKVQNEQTVYVSL